MLNDFFSLIYPNTCVICSKPLPNNKSKWCFLCDLRLPKTFLDPPHNSMHKALGHQFPITFGFAPYYFQKGNSIQQILHKLKYEGNKEIGKHIGTQIGLHMIQKEVLDDIDVIMPVPLHTSKLNSRGYNQSQIIGKTLSECVRKPQITDNLYRKRCSTTQTHKSRFKRWESTQGVFGLKDSTSLTGNHVAVVDDVFTTGATIGACLEVLGTVDKIKISVITVAIADY